MCAQYGYASWGVKLMFSKNRLQSLKAQNISLNCRQLFEFWKANVYTNCKMTALTGCCLKEMVFTCECSCRVRHLLADDQRVSGAVTRKALFYLNRLSHKCPHKWLSKLLISTCHVLNIRNKTLRWVIDKLNSLWSLRVVACKHLLFLFLFFSKLFCFVLKRSQTDYSTR